MATKWIVALVTALVQGLATAAVTVPSADVVRLDGHVLPALAQATRVTSAAKGQADPGAADDAPLTITVVLRRDDETGFQQYLREVYDPSSPSFHKFLTPAQVAQRFGPSLEIYDQAQAWLQSQGFDFVEGSTSRMTLTLRGTRAAAATAFAVAIDDYTIGARRFHANATEPAVPAALAAHVQAITGLSSLAQPQPLIANFEVALIKAFCAVGGVFSALGTGNAFLWEAAYLKQMARCIAGAASGLGAGTLTAPDPPPPAWQGVDGTGQTVGVVAFDRYDPADVANWIALNGMPASRLGNVSRVAVAGGASAGANASEVLLDISLLMSTAPGALIKVYDAPAGASGSYQAIFSAMISGGVTIISNSWAYCEDQTSLSDVQSIEAILQTAAASGISVVSAAGDHGTTCLDGSPNTAHVPASSPTITAVGGTSMTLGPGFTYGSETWWDSSGDSPPGGQGGYMTSRFFARPAYQDAISAASMRSLPDVAANADPAHGTMICQAAAGGCPNGMLYGGTSAAAPQWAAYVALLNQAQGANLGFLNPAFYLRANTPAFHTAASMGSDFTHVGLGSPNLARLHQSLTAQTTGAVDATVSIVEAYNATNFSMPPVATDGLPIPADGTTKAYVVVRLADAMGNIVDGHTIAIAPAGSAVITPINAVTSVANGAAIFAVTDLTVETLSFTATDTTSGTVLAQKAKVAFGVPAAASGSIVAFNPTVAADGVSTGTIQVTLQDALGRPTPGKKVVLNQTGSSVVVASNPGTTDASGHIDFKVSNTVQQGVTYTAVDITDGDLPVPGSATVTFSGGGGDNCGNSNFGDPNITAAPGYAITPYATGFLPRLVAGNGIIAQCRGAYGLAFDASGNLFVSSASDGAIYKFPVGGGAVGASTLLTPTPLGPFMAGLTFDKNGKLYAAQFATGGGNVFTGAVIEVNATTGAFVRTVASPITCASFLTTDPASGDLFVDDSCGGGGSENGSLWRIANPGSATPTTTVYAATTGTNGGLSFAPGGTLYVLDYFGTGVARVTGTASPTPGVLTPVHGITGPALDILALGNTGNGDAQRLVVSTAAQAGGLPAGMKMFDATGDPAAPVAMIMNNAYASVNLLGPDGCLYAGTYTTVYRITNADGTCPLRFDQPVLTLTPFTAAPNPAQGSTQSLTARFHFASVPEGTVVQFRVAGANAMVGMGRTDASGAATFSYKAFNPGKDVIVAAATLGTGTVVSNSANITWTAGPHPTIVNVDLSPGTANRNQATTVQATLVDATTDPSTPLAGQTVQFAAGAASCSGTTNAQGLASCVLTPTVVGAFTLTATFNGGTGLSPSSASRQLLVLAPPAASVSPSPTSLAFGSQVVATTSAAQSTTLTNSGGASFTLGTVGITGANASDFATTAGANACSNGAVLAAGASCTVHVAFTPAALGARAGNLVVTDAGGGPSITVPLSGTGVAPAGACYTGPLPGGGTATACVTGSLPACQFTSAAFAPVSSIATPPPAGVTLPWGVFEFVATGCGPQASVTITYPASIPPGSSYWKFGPTPGDPTGHWYTLPSTVSGSAITVSFVDGGTGDSDLSANGTIRDPGGAGYVAAPPVNTTPIPTLDRAALVLLALLLALLAVGRMARRRPGQTPV